MFDQVFENVRKVMESSLRAQQDMFRQWSQPWAASPPATATDWTASLQKRWIEIATENLNKHRELLDSAYKAAIDMLEQSFKVTEGRSPDEHRRAMEDLWRKFSDTLREQWENQFREFQKAAENWLSMSQRAKA